MIYEIVKTTAKQPIDVNWSQISELALVSNDGKSEVEYKTTCRMCYNTNGILFKFDVEDDKINCVMTGYNEPIYDEETVEFFIQPTSDMRKYVELEWNGIGGVFLANIDNDLNGTAAINFVEKNIVQSDIYGEDKGWSVLGFMPKSLFDAEMTGEWKFNAYRIKRRADDSMILLAYAPTLEETFHKPDKFAVLKFL